MASSLASPVKELVQAVYTDPPSSGPVAEWITKVSQGEVVKEANLKDLDSTLTPLTYLVNNEFSAADVALYGALHPVVSKLPPATYHSVPSVTRYFDHIQNSPLVRKTASTSFPLVTFDYSGAPPIERKAEAPKKKVKKDANPAAPPEGSTAAQPQGAAPVVVKEKAGQSAAEPAAEGAAGKKEKKEKPKKEAKPAQPSAAAAESSEPVPSMIDLRVGKIIDIKKHPDADGLYVEQIDLGEETGPRTVVSGLVNYIPIENMRDKYLVAVCNLKPASMRGVKSFAMVLCATHKDGKESGIELVAPPPNAKIGDRVYFEGEKYESAQPLEQLNPKKKVFETIQPGFTTLDSREAAWVDPVSKSVHRIRTKDGVCVAPNFVGASLS